MQQPLGVVGHQVIDSRRAGVVNSWLVGKEAVHVCTAYVVNYIAVGFCMHNNSQPGGLQQLHVCRHSVDVCNRPKGWVRVLGYHVPSGWLAACSYALWFLVLIKTCLCFLQCR